MPPVLHAASAGSGSTCRGLGGCGWAARGGSGSRRGRLGAHLAVRNGAVCLTQPEEKRHPEAESLKGKTRELQKERFTGRGGGEGLGRRRGKRQVFSQR